MTRYVRSDGSLGAPELGAIRDAPAHPGWVDPLVTGTTDGRFADLMPARRPPDGGPDGGPLRDSAVLVLLSGDPDASGQTPPTDATLLLTHRAPTLRSHSGQVAFPGGAADPGDGSPQVTALREAQEETGLDPAGVDVLAVTPSLYIPASRFEVFPVLGYWRAPSPVGVQDDGETARVMEVPLAQLLDPANRFLVQHTSGWTGPAFHLDDLVLWGFTAGVIAAMLHVAGWEEPWDLTDTRELEPTLAASANGERPGPLGRQMHREVRAALRDTTVAGVPGVQSRFETEDDAR